ncbi:Histidinol-phosphatase [Pseudobythopirellula maris]|uniref:3'(2'),5'-bisphosphate nucleotidase n=1 Tax=Pseudobythopirellula maris TaxID=2527991 RepID=A0A5C5ZNY6_9BACT|nr:3'(2'),5'-bisphosphate nucleotidase [Pseudobythopirellula maris]TWT88805.1 Histidinol-phosphatase [Pseudobythopirellula maris]
MLKRTPEIDFACDAVREAARLARRVQAEMVTDALTKGDKSPVTVGDFASQAVVARRLETALPGALLVGEESAADLREESGAATLEQVLKFVRESLPDATPAQVCEWIDCGASDWEADAWPDAYWTLDPIDGTKGFLRGDQYAVALGLIQGGEVQIGVLGCPELAVTTEGLRPERGGAGALLVAARGQGTWVQPIDGAGDDWRRLSVSDESDPTRTRMLRSVEKGHTNLGAIDHLGLAMGIAAEPVGMDSQAKYAVLAAGGGEMIVRLLSEDRPDYQEKIWDQAAGSIVVEEAGGRVTDLEGRPLDFGYGRTLAGNRGVVATNAHLHEDALAGLREIHA